LREGTEEDEEKFEGGTEEANDVKAKGTSE